MAFDINIVLNVVISMFFVMVVGYFLRKTDLIDGNVSKKLSKIVLQVAQPVLIVTSMMKMECTAENTKTLGKILLISLFAHSFAALFGWLTMRFIKDADARKLSEHSILFSNVLFVGLPIVQALLGDKGAAWSSFFSIIFHVFSWTYGMMVLGRGRDDIKPKLKNIFLNYGTVPCAIGVIMYFLNINSYVPEGISKGLGYIGGLCTPLSLLVLGGVMATIPFKKLFTNCKIYYVCLIKLIVLPLVVFLICKFVLHLDEEISMFTMILAGLPTASATNMFAELYDIKPGYAATAVGMTTVLSVATLPFIVYIAGLI